MEEINKRGESPDIVPVKPEKGKRIRSKERVEMPAEDNGKKIDAGGQAAISRDETSPFLQFFTPPVAPPKYDKDLEKRLQRTARVNALGDFLQQLGTLAGGGYAPVRPYQESKYLTKANAEIDRMQQVYEADRRRYDMEKRQHDNSITGMKMQDYGQQQNVYLKNKAEAIKTAREAYDKEVERIEKRYENRQKYGSSFDLQNMRDGSAYNRAWLAANNRKEKENKPFTEVQFKNSAVKVEATEGQVRKVIADLKDKYADILLKDKKDITPDERKIFDDIAMIDVSMESGQNKDAVKDVFARYLESNWDQLKYIFPDIQDASPAVTASPVEVGNGRTIDFSGVGPVRNDDNGGYDYGKLNF